MKMSDQFSFDAGYHDGLTGVLPNFESPAARLRRAA